VPGHQLGLVEVAAAIAAGPGRIVVVFIVLEKNYV
jgi:hypothetical protein